MSVALRIRFVMEQPGHWRLLNSPHYKLYLPWPLEMDCFGSKLAVSVVAVWSMLYLETFSQRAAETIFAFRLVGIDFMFKRACHVLKKETRRSLKTKTFSWSHLRNVKKHSFVTFFFEYPYQTESLTSYIILKFWYSVLYKNLQIIICLKVRLPNPVIDSNNRLHNVKFKKIRILVKNIERELQEVGRRTFEI